MIKVIALSIIIVFSNSNLIGIVNSINAFFSQDHESGCNWSSWAGGYINQYCQSYSSLDHFGVYFGCYYCGKDYTVGTGFDWLFCSGSEHLDVVDKLSSSILYLVS